MQKGIIRLENQPYIIASGAVVGKKEHDGPLGRHFAAYDETDTFGMPTWEQSESEMQRLALNRALDSGGMKIHDIDAIFAGDLINQCTSSGYGLANFDAPFFGVFGACSTIAEALILASLLVDSGKFERTAAVTSSHNCTAERQFRSPIEYGGQRAPTAQWTVTGSAAFVVGSKPNCVKSGEAADSKMSCVQSGEAADSKTSCVQSDRTSDGGTDCNQSGEATGSKADHVYIPRIIEVLPGRVTDKGINDAANMGAAMAPAAVDTLSRYFDESRLAPDEFSAIFTGDLGYEGSGILVDFLRARGIDIGKVHRDCGLMIYDRERQDVHAGGSGCGCSACVLQGYILDELRKGRLRDLLFVATGAMMNQASLQQGLTIPGIAHLVRISASEVTK